MSKKQPPEYARAQAAMTEGWGGVVEYLAFEASKEGLESSVLQHLEPFPYTAFDIAWSEMSVDDPYFRCVGALIPGSVPGMRADALEIFWDAECKRRKELSRDDFAQVMANTVAERILISAVRWLKVPDRRDGAIAILEDMITHTIKGTFWNDSHFAAAALLHAEAPGAEALATRLAESKLGREHLTVFMAGLLAGDPEYRLQAESLADDRQARRHKLSSQFAARVKAMVAGCALWEPIARVAAEE